MADAEEVVRRVTMQEGVTYRGLYLNEQGLHRAMATGRLKIDGSISLTASPAFLKRNQNATPEQQKDSCRRMARLIQSQGNKNLHR